MMMMMMMTMMIKMTMMVMTTVMKIVTDARKALEMMTIYDTTVVD